MEGNTHALMEEQSIDRKGFLKYVGGTLLAGLGLFSLSAAFAEDAKADCLIYCTQKCGTGLCNNGRRCPSGRRCFRCRDYCRNRTTNICLRQSGSCRSFCLSTTCN